MTIHCRSEAETAAAGASLASELRLGDAVLLHGEMGAGKSVFARGAARALGVTGAMPSPTFLLMLPYDADGVTIYHMDLYRLNGDEDFFAAGLYESLPRGISFIEWPERCPCVYTLARRVVGVRVDYGEQADDRLIHITINPS